MSITLKIYHEVCVKECDEFPHGIHDFCTNFEFKSFDECFAFIKIFDKHNYDAAWYKIEKIDE